MDNKYKCEVIEKTTAQVVLDLLKRIGKANMNVNIIKNFMQNRIKRKNKKIYLKGDK